MEAKDWLSMHPPIASILGIQASRHPSSYLPV